MLKLIDEAYYEILQILNEKGRVQATRLPELVTSASQSTVFEKVKELEQSCLVASEWKEVPDRNRPLKFYYLTDYGKLVVKKLEELEAILQAAKAGETWIKVGEVEID